MTAGGMGPAGTLNEDKENMVEGQQGRQGQQGQPNQGQPIQIDPAKAFQRLQARYAEDLSRAAGDIAAKDAAIDMLAEENRSLKEQVDKMDQEIARLSEVLGVTSSNGQKDPVPSIPSTENVPAPSMVLGPAPIPIPPGES